MGGARLRHCVFRANYVLDVLCAKVMDSVEEALLALDREARRLDSRERDMRDCI